MLKVVFANGSRSWAGVKTWMYEVAHYLANEGDHPLIICRRNDVLINKCQAAKIPVSPIEFGPDYNPICIRRIRNAMREHSANVLFTNTSKELRTAGLAAKSLGVVHVNRLGNVTDLKHNLQNQMDYRSLVDHVVVPSKKIKERFEKQNYLAEKIKYFPNAILPLTFRPKLEFDKVQFGILAKLTKRKQIDKVLHAFAQVAGKNWHLHIGGNGPELDLLINLTHRLELNAKVTFHGWVNAEDFFKGIHVNVLYSKFEGMPWSILEAMNNSCMVIASNIPGIDEVIVENRDGILVNPHEPEELTCAIALVLDQPDKIFFYAKNAHARVKKNFNRAMAFTRFRAWTASLVIDSDLSAARFGNI